MKGSRKFTRKCDESLAKNVPEKWDDYVINKVILCKNHAWNVMRNVLHWACRNACQKRVGSG